MCLRDKIYQSLFLVIVVLCFSAPSFGQAPQPTSFTVSPSSLTRGQCYTITVDNGANMTLDIQYTLNSMEPQEIDGYPSLDGNGQVCICTDELTAVGTYIFIAVRNTLNTDWVPVYVPLVVNAPPQPTSFTVSPNVLTQGQCYTIAVDNGANMTLDILYTFNFGDPQEID
jgi:hypothetical protein